VVTMPPIGPRLVIVRVEPLSERRVSTNLADARAWP
jgi:hypothetical protein